MAQISVQKGNTQVMGDLLPAPMPGVLAGGEEEDPVLDLPIVIAVVRSKLGHYYVHFVQGMKVFRVRQAEHYKTLNILINYVEKNGQGAEVWSYDLLKNCHYRHYQWLIMLPARQIMNLLDTSADDGEWELFKELLHFVTTDPKNPNEWGEKIW